MITSAIVSQFAVPLLMSFYSLSLESGVGDVDVVKGDSSDQELASILREETEVDQATEIELWFSQTSSR